MKKLIMVASIFMLFSGTSYSEQLTFAKIKNAADQMVMEKMVEIVYRKLGFSTKFRVIQSKRALQMSSDGEVDGETARVYNVGVAYPTLLRVPTPINYIEPSVFSKNLDFTVTDCNALKKYRIAIVRGAKMAEDCARGAKRVWPMISAKQAFKFLDQDRADIVLIAKISGLLALKRLNMTSVRLLSPPLQKMWLYHYLNEKHRELVPKVDQILKNMTKSGELKKLRDKLSTELLEKGSL